MCKGGWARLNIGYPPGRLDSAWKGDSEQKSPGTSRGFFLPDREAALFEPCSKS
jgi:hypothetical protein